MSHPSRFLARLLAAFVAAALGACRSDEVVATTSSPIAVGLYQLSTVNGIVIPATLADQPRYFYSVEGGSITLHVFNTYEWQLVTRTIDGDRSTIRFATSIGTYGVQGSALTFHPLDGSASTEAALGPRTVTIRSATETYIYAR